MTTKPTPQEIREALTAVLRFCKDHPATFMHYIGGGDAHALALTALRESLDAEPVARIGCQECDCSFACFDGKQNCIRLLPPAAPSAQALDIELDEDVRDELARVMPKPEGSDEH